MLTPSYRPSLFHRAAVVIAVALTTLLVVVCIGLLMFMPGCSPAANAQVKPILRAVDEHVQLACEGLAQSLAERSGADAQRIIATSCAVERVTRLMRELLLSEQIEAAKAAGVAVPDINSGQLENEPYQMQDAE
jgi:uncharacterized membrane protein affecting hemolysin expression